jgi:hypothetical protein
MAALLAVGVGLTALTVIASTQEPSPSQIGVVVAPTSFAERLPPMPIAVVELQDAKGRRVGRSGDSIHVAIERGGTLGGVTTAATNDGRASFPDATILTVDTADLVLRFTGPGLRPARVHVSGAAEAQSTLQLVSATLNGQALTDAAKTIRITTGDSIAGSLEFRYTSGWVAAAVVLGVTSTWTERSRAFSTIGALTTPASGVAYRANIRLAGPRLPGRYHLIFAFQAEDAVSFVMSGTNWQVGAPVWNDGNDVVDWTEGQLEEAQREGHVRSTVLRPTGRYQATVPAAVIDVEAVIPRQ